MDCGIFTSKTILLFLSLVFWAAGAALAYVGSYVIINYANFSSFIEDNYTIPAIVIIAVSVVMFIFGLLGCCATIRESKVGLSCFFAIIFLIFAAEVAALVLGIIFRGKISGGLQRSMNDTFSEYDKQTNVVDDLQTRFHCCGVTNYTDWSNTTCTQCTGRLDQPDLLYTKGCETQLERFLQDVLTYAMLVILGFAIIKFFGMLSVCVIGCRTSSQRRASLCLRPAATSSVCSTRFF
uniref:Tetraspanin n=1 Tax=Monopterus albus TaxID=43700 RepID=A0A3Q3QYM8_MONAL